MNCPDCGRDDVAVENGVLVGHRWPGKHPRTVCDMSYQPPPVESTDCTVIADHRGCSVRTVRGGMPTLGKDR